MKKHIVFLLLILICLAKSKGQVYMADSCKIGFFSKTSMKDIDAENRISKPLLNIATGDIEINISNPDFIFKSKLMQKHFNEEYMESAKYPHSAFKGKVNEKVDYTKDGVTNVTVTGTMDMHGVQKTITIPGTLTIKNGVIFLFSKFDIAMADYHIKPPSILGSSLTDHVAVTFNATMKPYTAK